MQFRIGQNRYIWHFDWEKCLKSITGSKKLIFHHMMSANLEFGEINNDVTIYQTKKSQEDPK